MNKVYARIHWENYPSDATPLNEANLNKIDGAADELDNRIIVLDASKFDKTEAAKLVKGIEFDRATGVFTITQYNGATMVIDTMLEKLAVNFDYEPVTQKLVITLDDGTVKYIDLSALITQYEFLDSDTVAFSVNSAGKVTAIVKEGSIGEKHLRPNYLADIKVEVAKAQASATAAATSETNAKTSETNAAASAQSAATDASAAAQQATNAANAAGAAQENATAAAASKEAAATSETNAANAASVASQKATDADNSAASASSSAETAAQKAADAGTFADAAAGSAAEAESYAHGGTGTREGEDADNAKEYARQAKESADKAADIAGGNFIPSSEKGAVNGVATLDSVGKVPESQLPENDYAVGKGLTFFVQDGILNVTYDE